MPKVTISKTINADPAAVWALLSDFARLDWIPIIKDIETTGEGPGMRRIVHGAGSQPAVEQLEWIDPQAQAFAYQVEQTPLPVTRLSAVATVGSHSGAIVTWQIDYEPIGDDESARDAIEQAYSAVVGWLENATR